MDTRPAGLAPRAWLQRYCPCLDGQYLFLDPVCGDTHLLTEGAVVVLQQAAEAIEQDDFDSFVADVMAAGGWPPGLEFLARALATLADAGSPAVRT